jgi:hypothetical protein
MYTASMQNVAHRRNLVIPSDLYESAREAAALEGARLRRTVSISEWVREAIAQRLQREEERAA